MSYVAKKKLRVAVITDYQGAYSEGFIKAHIDHLAICVIFTHQLSWKDPEPYHHQTGTLERIKASVKNFLTAITNAVDRQRVSRILRKNKIDVVLAEYGHVGIIAHKLLLRTTIPLVVHFHGIDAYLKRLLHARAQSYQAMFAYCQGLVAVSRDMQQQLIQLGAPAEKVFYNPYGVDLQHFSQATPSTAGLHALAAGRFVEKKAPYLTILAFQKVLNEVPEAQLTMLGDGPLLDLCQRMVKSLHLESAIHLPGAVEQEEVSLWMRKTRIFVQHSLVPLSGDSEGTPNTILEAGASGIPVVSTRHAGIKDVVLHGRTGFLVEEGDIEGMAQYIIQLLQNASLADTIGQAAREHVQENYRLDKSLDNLHRILAQAAYA